MKFTVKIVETTERVIEVEANDYAEMKHMLHGGREEVGKEVQHETTVEWFAEPQGENGKHYPKIRWI